MKSSTPANKLRGHRIIHENHPGDTEGSEVAVGNIHINAAHGSPPHKNHLHWRGVALIGGMFMLILAVATVSTLIHTKSDQNPAAPASAHTHESQLNTDHPSTAFISKAITDEPKADTEERLPDEPEISISQRPGELVNDQNSNSPIEFLGSDIALQTTHPQQANISQDINTVILPELAGNVTADTRQRILSYYVKLASSAKAQGEELRADFYTLKARAVLFGQEE